MLGDCSLWTGGSGVVAGRPGVFWDEDGVMACRGPLPKGTRPPADISLAGALSSPFFCCFFLCCDMRLVF